MSVVKILAIRNTVCDNYRIGAIWVLSVLIPSLTMQRFGINVNTLFIHCVLTPTPGGVETY